MLRKVLDRESQVKANLIKRLVECVKELQFKYAADKGAALVTDETTNMLCWILEAVFIHGLKSTFLKTVITSVFQTRENPPPEPSFWEFVLVFCHQDVIINLNKLSFISTDVGRSRAWLRLALNDGLLISYLQIMLKDKNVLKDYYKPNAFLRDSEMCDMLKSYLYGIESYSFELATNSSLLNAWNSAPLSLVGLCTVSNPYESVSEGIDVVENMHSKDLQILPSLRSGRSSPVVQTPPNVVYLRNSSLDEEAALKVILSKPSTGSKPSSRRSSISSTPPTEQVLANFQPLLLSDFNSNHQVDINMTQPSTSSSQIGPANRIIEDMTLYKRNVEVENFVESNENALQFIETPGLHPKDVSESCESASALINETTGAIETLKDRSEGTHAHSDSKTPAVTETGLSFNDLLLQNCLEPLGTPIRCSILEGVLRTRSTSGHADEENRASTPISPADKLGLEFEIVSPFIRTSLIMRMSQAQSFLDHLPKEVGLDEQDYKCKSCDTPIGMFYGLAKYCSLTGNYFCHNCHVNDESIVPARIIFNWDFERYLVSKKAKEVLQESFEEPLFDIELLNRSIYNEIEEFEELKKLRMKLKYIAGYLKTCKESNVIKDFAKGIWPREHLFDSVHLYSVADLQAIPSRNLATALMKLENFGRTHIISCENCTQKGFICEICKDTQVIFPFDIEKTFKCPSCGAVFHATCFDSKIPCPRCERWKLRTAAENL